MRDDLGLRLHGAHLDHGLRGDASAADAEFAVESFRKLGIDSTVDRADVNSARLSRRQSLEEAAREVRLDFLAGVAREQGTDSIALGHTADDQAETVLMRILRGTGITGLRGMEPSSRRLIDGYEVSLLRPLLEVKRALTEEYCRELSLDPRVDESNLSPEITRNRVRSKLLPLMEQYNPAVREALLRLSRSAAQDASYIEAGTDVVWREISRCDDTAVELEKSELAALAPALLSGLLRRAVLAVKGDLRNLTQRHIEDMVRLSLGPAGKSLDLPGGIRFTTGYTEVRLTRSEDMPAPLPLLEGQFELAVPGETEIAGWTVSAIPLDASASPAGTEEGTNEVFGHDHTAYLDYDSLGGPLSVRSRNDGDRFQPLGMSQAKKLQDFMVDSKIPRSWRDRVPLVVSPEGIAWVVGWRIADWAKVRQGSARRLEIRFRRL